SPRGARRRAGAGRRRWRRRSRSPFFVGCSWGSVLFAKGRKALSAARRCTGKRMPAATAKVAPGAGQAIAANLSVRGGKSGLQWTRCQVTPGGREPTESATESKPPKCRKALVRVKGCGKSAPRRWQHSTARQTPPGARPNREVGAHPQGWGASVGPALLPGRLLEGRGDAAPRGMIAPDRTRLIGQLLLFLALNPKSRNPKEFF